MLALLMEQLDKSLRSGRQIERVLQVPCLGMVPTVSGLRRDQSPHGYLRQKQRSTYAVSIRALYTSILMDQAGPTPKIILVTSALPGEGKTSLASSLAVLAAQSGKRAVLVDLDLWHPQIAREFGVRPACGVGEVIANGRSLDDALVTDDPSGLDLLPAVASSNDPARLIASQRLRWLLDELRERYDCIVLDSPPLLGPADAEILSLYADATLFVVRWERTKQDAASAAVKGLRDLSANIAGAVLTQVDLKRHARYRYGDAVQYSDECRKYYIN
jgi:capsular exopolysaccharide synthesis family protein